MHKKLVNSPLVTVIIPAYNEEKYIQKCLDSLKNQTLENFEIIVVDDGSTDSTKQIASKLGVKVTSLTHGGPGRAKNYGARIASGKILVFLDADMFVEKSYLKKIIKPIIERKCIATYTTTEFVLNTKNMWSRCWNINLELPISQRISKKDTTIGQAFRAILRDRFIEIGGFNPQWGYNDDRSLSTFKLKPCPVNNAICYHHNPESLIETFLAARWIGRSIQFKSNSENMLRYSILNSIRNSINKIFNGAPLYFLIFKIIFDAGISAGIIDKNYKRNFAK